MREESEEKELRGTEAEVEASGRPFVVGHEGRTEEAVLCVQMRGGVCRVRSEDCCRERGAGCGEGSAMREQENGR
eukprot:5997058-Pleurochrysis_carterae.AAC.2